MKRHLLLGNGFSISLFPNRFRYDSLLESANFSAYPETRQAFSVLATTDFEVVINALRQAIALLPLYGTEGATERLMSQHASVLKELLVQAIAGRHPERPSDISDEQYRACRTFLAHCSGDSRNVDKDLRGHIYTLNYDLLLYWTLLHDMFWVRDPADPLGLQEAEAELIAHDDGFRSPEDDPAAEYVTWDAEEAHDQNIHYLHGALHLFDHGLELQKRCWQRAGGIALIDQIRSALDESRFPLFVSEGHGRGKLEHIRHSAYLHKALRSFRGNCNVKKTAFFIFGHSLADSDAHILKQIEKGKCGRVFIGLYGDLNNEANRATAARAALMTANRGDRNSLEIEFYNASTAQLWHE